MTRAKDLASFGDSAVALKSKKDEGIITQSSTGVIGSAHMTDGGKVIESEGIPSNDNDTTLPTSAAVKDFVDTAIAGSPSGISTGKAIAMAMVFG